MSAPVQNIDQTLLDDGRTLAKSLLDKYFKTTEYPYTNHHIGSFDQFLMTDLPLIIQSQNPIIILKDAIDADRNIYKHKAEIYIGGKDGKSINIGSPTLSLQNGNEVRLLFPNEARLRNLTYASTVYVDIYIKLYINSIERGSVTNEIELPVYKNFPIFRIPIMLHSSYCLLNGKPKEFLEEAGECPYDHGGYFIIDGSEKVLITRQEQAFNTLYISTKPRDPKVSIYANIYSLSPSTRRVSMVSFALMRERYKNVLSRDKKQEVDKPLYQSETIQVTLPMVRKPIPLFVLFRALGIQSDEDIMNTIFPDIDGAEAKLLADRLIPSITEAAPFLNKWTAIQYIMILTKGYSEAHVIDILRNKLFTHIEDTPGARAAFLGDCVRSILRVAAGIDPPTDKDDIRNQRCLVSGFLIQTLFSDSYMFWIKNISKTIGSEYSYNKSLYEGENFQYIFSPGNLNTIFLPGQMTETLTKAFKGKWGSGLGEEKAGVLQALSRLSYLDFMSHCRRVVLDFDTGLKLTGPRHLHPSQFGYFCTNETPGGSSIGISKNLSIMTQISTAMTNLPAFTKWLFRKGEVIITNDVPLDTKVIMTPVYVNGGILGYTAKPQQLTTVLRLFKHTGFLPYSTSITFNIRTKRLLIYADEGRPLRPLIILDKGELNISRITSLPTWRDLIFGTHPERRHITLKSSEFIDPLESRQKVDLAEYITALGPHRGSIEYVDPYEHNETYVATFLSHRKPETTHLEVHPSTMLSILTSLIPFPNHNQSPRNQLSDSQSKQGISLYATNWKNRYDNTAHVLCYGQTPLSRTLYTDYLGEGKMPYGQNIVVAIAAFTGYNQEDGIVINRDALERGLFRTLAYKSYEAFEEDDPKAHTHVRFSNPAKIPNWLDLKPGRDYSKLDENGFIKVGEFVDENTVIAAAYMIDANGTYKDASVTPQVWTSGRVESVVITVNNNGLRLIKIRVAHDRMPVLGDKFSNRHGQKGTIGMIVRGCDMPRATNGVIPDIIMNPHAIPSRMTMGQILEQLLGKLCARVGCLGDATAFMNEGSPVDMIGGLLEKMGVEKYGNEFLYNGMTGEMIPSYVFMGQLYGMRLKHMVEDKWQARGKGRKEQRTHQPTGGRGNQGGLKIGEQERDGISCHGTSMFLRESVMDRSDGAEFPICTGCGTIPIYNPSLNISICTLCDGPVKFSGSNVNNLEIIPPTKKPTGEIIKVNIPYSTKLLEQELNTFMNICMRLVTTRGVDKIRGVDLEKIAGLVEVKDLAAIEQRILPELNAPKLQEITEDVLPMEELEAAASRVNMTLVPKAAVEELEEGKIVLEPALTEEEKNEVVVGREAEGLEGPIDEEDFDEFDIQLPGEFNRNATSGITTAMTGMTALPEQGIVPPQPMVEYSAATPSVGGTLLIDTSPNAMASMGLAPVEQTQAGIMPPMGGGYQQQQQPRPRAPRRRQPQQQMWGGMPQQQQPMWGGMAQQQQQQQPQSQPQRQFTDIPQGYTGAVSIKKLD
jgi:DNA-directed RNA polymerase II subunit RPB2